MKNNCQVVWGILKRTLTERSTLVKSISSVITEKRILCSTVITTGFMVLFGVPIVNP